MTDVGEYCRQVESYLTRVNGGHLVRIVGPGFELVRQWADEGIPLSVVYRGIELKVDRQQTSAGLDVHGRARRPLRIEFCEADVRDVYESWRRAVGLPLQPLEPTSAEEKGAEPAVAAASSKRRSLSKHLDRAIDRLARAGGSLNLPDSFRGLLARLVDDLSAVRDTAKGVRGPARAEILDQLLQLDRELMTAARTAVPEPTLVTLANAAEEDLRPFRARLSAASWQNALDATVDRLVRDRLGLPTLELHM